MTADKRPEIPDLGARYSDLRAISGTGRALTFAARDETSGGEVFIKALSQDRATRPEAVAAFLHEAEVLKLLAARIPPDRVVPVLEVSWLDAVPYIVQPLLSGWSLSHAMARRVAFHVLSAIRLVEQCLETLICVHGAGIVHGDISPENIFVVTGSELRQDGILPDSFSTRLVDFESARRLQGEENQPGRPVFGKAPYLAPELAKGGALSPQSDLYAVGVLLYEMLAGHLPYRAHTLEDLRRLEPSSVQPIALALGVPQLVESFMHSLLAVDQRRRLTTASEALPRLRQLLEVHECLNRSAPPLPLTPRQSAELREAADYIEARTEVPTGSYPPQKCVQLERSNRISDVPVPRATVRPCEPLPQAAEEFLRRVEITTSMAVPLLDLAGCEQLVDFSIFSPSVVSPGATFLLDVWTYLPAQRQEMCERAVRRLRQAEVGSRGAVGLPEGAELAMELQLDGFQTDNPIEGFRWQGAVGNVSFYVRVPEGMPPRVYPGQVQVLAAGMLITRMFFEVVVQQDAHGMSPELAREVAQTQQRIRSAFASYSSHDREQVVLRVQGISAAGVDVFLDVISLRAGQQWEKQLQRAIENSDVFYLFWSENARRSKGVEREWRHTLERRGLDFIHPIPLQDPRLIRPPMELSSLHFNDVFLACGHTGRGGAGSDVGT